MRSVAFAVLFIALMTIADSAQAQLRGCSVGPRRVIVQQFVQPSPFVLQQVQGVQFVPLVQQVRFTPVVQQVRGVGPVRGGFGNFIDNRRLIRQARSLRNDVFFAPPPRFVAPLIVF